MIIINSIGPLATKNRPNQLTVPVWTEPNSNRTEGDSS